MFAATKHLSRQKLYLSQLPPSLSGSSGRYSCRISPAEHPKAIMANSCVLPSLSLSLLLLICTQLRQLFNWLMTQDNPYFGEWQQEKDDEGERPLFSCPPAQHWPTTLPPAEHEQEEPLGLLSANPVLNRTRPVHYQQTKVNCQTHTTKIGVAYRQLIRHATASKYKVHKLYHRYTVRVYFFKDVLWWSLCTLYFTRTGGESYRRRLGSLLLGLFDVTRTLIISLVSCIWQTSENVCF